MRDRPTIFAVIVTAATEAPRASILMMAMTDLTLSSHCLVVPVLTHVPAASCGKGSSSSTSQSAGTQIRELVVVKICSDPGRTAWLAEVRMNCVGVHCAQPGIDVHYVRP